MELLNGVCSVRDTYLQYHSLLVEPQKMINKARLFIEEESVLFAEAGSCGQERTLIKDRRR